MGWKRKQRKYDVTAAVPDGAGAAATRQKRSWSRRGRAARETAATDTDVQRRNTEPGATTRSVTNPGFVMIRAPTTPQLHLQGARAAACLSLDGEAGPTQLKFIAGHAAPPATVKRSRR